MVFGFGLVKIQMAEYMELGWEFTVLLVLAA
jgi:hypothetical protein